ncbi:MULTISPECIES: lysoplasmalogenase [Pseudomonas]|uniref:Putative membrane protein n=1 Tax=Pseudomonas fluorescens (strain Pf0-1) TaxID=205922 RepID=Q3K7D6_PSEPF|nr:MULTISPECIES: lysoplasmalogenase [Pseudomonas]MBL0794176.1 lysoplasmalogenase [Pseudomonas sp. B7]ABA76318.1 putative membrane protein [Pseudomonas fluorescens Pf0-1]MBX8623043.1 lysoplasmalogenase [Pseudomonas glycinae]MBY9024246.1 lysoplasmalogenase [Pseudomonas fluorescens]MBY9030559.1 lysoplasmalogenase [Pseudomonas fluorescens]
MGWLILALMGAVTFLYGLSTHAALLCLLVKPLPVLALLGWLHDAPPSDYRRWISLGLIFSLVGDVLLAWPGDLFVFGLGAFLVAHLAYLKAYLSDCRRPALLPLVLALSVGAVLLGILISSGLGPLTVPVIVYGTAISAMLWRALARLGSDVPQRSALLAAGGAVAFVFSDSVIGINRFVSPFNAAPYIIILSYWLGQWGIAASAFSQSKRPEL